MKLSDNPFYSNPKKRPNTYKRYTPCAWEKSLNQQMDELEFRLISQALEESKGLPLVAAQICGLANSTFKMKMYKLGIKSEDYREQKNEKSEISIR